MVFPQQSHSKEPFSLTSRSSSLRMRQILLTRGRCLAPVVLRRQPPHKPFDASSRMSRICRLRIIYPLLFPPTGYVPAAESSHAAPSPPESSDKPNLPSPPEN